MQGKDIIFTEHDIITLVCEFITQMTQTTQEQVL